MKFILWLIMLASGTSALARDTVVLAYSWTAGDKAANYYRALVDEANKIQNNINFVFEPKPGAGGTIAANYAANNPNSVLWINSSAGFIRPHLFPNDSHDITKFRSILPMCISPFVIISAKYSSWQDVPKDARLSIGNSGLGTTTHLVSLQIQKNFPNMTIVPFKSTSEALLGVLSGSVDFSVGFFGDSEEYAKSNAPRQVYWLGQTGREKTKGVDLLANQGFSKDLLDMSTPQQIFAARSIDPQRFSDIRKVLVQAARAPSVASGNAADTCSPNNQMADKELETWFAGQISHWARLTRGVKIDR